MGFSVASDNFLFIVLQLIFFLLFMMQPHGFFNCSPAVDVPPSASDLDDKENGMSAKPIQNGMVALL